MYEDELSPALILSIQRVLAKSTEQEKDTPQDPLDVLGSDFSPVAMLNTLFPNEASLGEIQAVQARLAQTEDVLEREISSLHAELRESHDPTRMQLLQDMIADLLGQMSRIREKATESEAVVRDITKDIQVLDLAKRNLITSMTALKRLQMLVNALTQLDELVRDKKYAEIAQTLSAVKQLSTSFKGYTGVPRIAQVWSRMQDLQGVLRTHIEADFDAFLLQSPAAPAPATLNAICAAADVLSPDVRRAFAARTAALELKEYARVFRAVPGNEAGALDNASRRYAWYRRREGEWEREQGRWMGDEWATDVGEALVGRFVEMTRDDMASLLGKAGASLTVKQLLDALQTTTEFEASLARKYGKPLQEILNSASGNANPAPKTISSAFDPHMGVFVDAQDKAIADMLAPHRNPKSRPKTSADMSESARTDGEEEEPSVMPSSTELFYFYGQSLEQCAKLSTGKALFDLGRTCRKWLRIYAEDVLIASMKKPIIQTQARKSMDTRIDPQDLQRACLVTNTADYCQSTALELEEKIREKIDEEYKEKVTMQAERDVFVSVISSAINHLLRELETSCDPSFNMMARTTWGSLSQVTGPSPYVGDLVRGIEAVVDLVRPHVNGKKYLRNWFDKVSSLVLTKFTNAIVKSRPLKDIGAEQLLIDLQSVKACLMKIPGEELITPAYTRGVTKGTTRLEALLKVIVTPVDPPEGFILNYTLLIGDLSFSNFQKILDLKGTPKGDQNSLLDSFVLITSTKTELESTSFLSSLDMDPPTTAQISSNVGSPNASRVSLPLAGSEGMFGALASPPLSGPSTGSSDVGGPRTAESTGPKFSDFRRFVSFGLRRDSQPQS